MNVRKTLAVAISAGALALGSSSVFAQANCETINTIAQWAAAGSCEQGDKTFSFGSTNLLGNAGLDFFGNGTFGFAINNFDNGPGAQSWTLNYSVAVNDPTKFIHAMAAGADNPFGTEPGFGSLLEKGVVGDPGGAFMLKVVDGVEDAGSFQLGLHATALGITETFSVEALGTLASVSNTFFQADVPVVPEPDTLLLFALGLLGLGWFARHRKIG